MSELVLCTGVSSGLTTGTTAYSADDQMGAIVQISGVVANAGDEALLTSLQVLDKSTRLNAFDIYIFDSSITVASDNAAASFANADVDSAVLQGVEAFSPGYRHGSAVNGFFSMDGLGLVVKPAATSLYIATVARTVLTSPGYFAATTDMEFVLGILRP